MTVGGFAAVGVGGMLVGAILERRLSHGIMSHIVGRVLPNGDDELVRLSCLSYNFRYADDATAGR